MESWCYDTELESPNPLLKDVVDRLAAARSLPEIVAVVRYGARRACSADGVSFVLRRGDDCHYWEEDAIAPLWKGQRFPMESCISGWTMLNSRTAVIEDVFADPRIPHDVYRRTFVKSLIMAPVRLNKPVAAIGAYWAERRKFAPQEIGAVETMAAAIPTLPIETAQIAAR